MARAIVTGATGFIGANLLRRLIHDGHQVHALVRAEHSSWRIADVRAHVNLHVVDLTDAVGLEAIVRDIAPTWVFHLAAYGAYPEQTSLPSMVRTNIVATLNLVEASAHAGAMALVNAGSSSEYGAKDHAPSEAEAVAPLDGYGATKLCATLLCRQAALGYAGQMQVTTLRLYSVYGPFEQSSRLMPRLVAMGLQGRLPPLANPRTARDFVFVDDVVEAFLLAATTSAEPGAIFNVGSGVQSSLESVVAIVRTVLHVSQPAYWGHYPDRHWDTDVWVADTTRSRQELGWTASHGLEAGVVQFANWFRAHPEYLQVYERWIGG